MPELPEVETIKEALNQAIFGATIRDIKVFNKNFRVLIPDDFGDLLKAATICDIYRIAKYIILSLDNGYSIIWHLGMSGKIKILQENPDVYEKHDHVVFLTDKGVLIFNDARRFGLITYEKTENLMHTSFFKSIGLDPFSNKLTPQYLQNLYKSKTVAIKVALLDQGIIVGIGNIYASEALYEARISPLCPCNQLNLQQLENLIKAIRHTLEKAIKAGGSTLKDYRKPDGSMGYFQQQHCVYNKAGTRCPDCICNLNKTGGIRRINQCGRSTFYCETLQK